MGRKRGGRGEGGGEEEGRGGGGGGGQLPTAKAGKSGRARCQPERYYGLASAVAKIKTSRDVDGAVEVDVQLDDALFLDAITDYLTKTTSLFPCVGCIVLPYTQFLAQAEMIKTPSPPPIAPHPHPHARMQRSCHRPLAQALQLDELEDDEAERELRSAFGSSCPSSRMRLCLLLKSGSRLQSIDRASFFSMKSRLLSSSSPFLHAGNAFKR